MQKNIGKVIHHNLVLDRNLILLDLIEKIKEIHTTFQALVLVFVEVRIHIIELGFIIVQFWLRVICFASLRAIPIRIDFSIRVLFILARQ